MRARSRVGFARCGLRDRDPPFHHEAFTRLADIARRKVRGDALTPEDEAFLADCRARDAIFPDVDLEWWRRVERPAE